MKILALIVFLHLLFLPMALVFYQLLYTYVYGAVLTRSLNIGTALVAGSYGLKDAFLYKLTALDQQMVCNLGRVLSPPNSSLRNLMKLPTQKQLNGWLKFYEQKDNIFNKYTSYATVPGTTISITKHIGKDKTSSFRLMPMFFRSSFLGTDNPEKIVDAVGNVLSRYSKVNQTLCSQLLESDLVDYVDEHTGISIKYTTLEPPISEVKLTSKQLKEFFTTYSETREYDFWMNPSLPSYISLPHERNKAFNVYTDESIPHGTVFVIQQDAKIFTNFLTQGENPTPNEPGPWIRGSKANSGETTIQIGIASLPLLKNTDKITRYRVVD